MTKNKKNLEKKIDGITDIELSQDEKGFYIPYCILPYHPGVISTGRAEICESRKCENLKRLYIK